MHLFGATTWVEKEGGQSGREQPVREIQAPIRLLSSSSLAACSQRGRRPSRSPGTVGFQPGGGPLEPQSALLHPDAASVEAQLARLAFEPFVDLDAGGSLVPALLDRIPTAENGGVSPDRHDLDLPASPGRSLERRSAGNRVPTCCSRSAKYWIRETRFGPTRATMIIAARRRRDARDGRACI